jgi:hypothetical protein
MKKNDNGLDELLELLKSRPELISALVFDPASIKRLLKSKAARRLLIGVEAKTFLRRIVDNPIALCVVRTANLIGKTKRCRRHTKCQLTGAIFCLRKSGGG